MFERGEKQLKTELEKGKKQTQTDKLREIE